MDVTAEVKSLQNFGVFVDLGGIDGLIPLSEISWDRGVDPRRNPLHRAEHHCEDHLIRLGEKPSRTEFKGNAA